MKSYEILVDHLPDGKAVTVHVEVSGTGVPVIYMHGGPGDQITPKMRELFDPAKYMLVMYDQRGCGLSKPRDHLQKNTTHHLLNDVEVIRKHLGIEKMVVSGGSWGTSLALLYAEKHPDRVLGLILRGVFDMDTSDSVLRAAFPEKFDQLTKLMKIKKPADYFKTLMRTLKRPSKTRSKVIDILGSSFGLSVYGKHDFEDTTRDKTTQVRIGAHYEGNHFFLPRGTIRRKLGKIKHLPVLMVNGRVDIVTPVAIGYELCKRLPNCRLEVVDAGHTIHEPALAAAFKKAAERMLRLL